MKTDNGGSDNPQIYCYNRSLKLFTIYSSKI